MVIRNMKQQQGHGPGAREYGPVLNGLVPGAAAAAALGNRVLAGRKDENGEPF